MLYRLPITSRLWATLCTTLLQKTGRALLVLVAVLMVAGAFVQDNARDPFAIAAVTVGGGLLALGCLLPFIRRLKVAGLDFEAGDTAQVQAAEQALETDRERERGTIEVDPPEIVNSARFGAAELALITILGTGNEDLDDAELRLFLFDADKRRLLPVFEPEERLAASQGWAPGQGAVGAAWDLGREVVAAWPQTCDDTYGLSVDQQQRYQNLRAVLAVPVTDAGGTAIGVIAASVTWLDSDDPSDYAALGPGRLVENEAQVEVLYRSLLVARVLIDLLGWFTDE